MIKPKYNITRENTLAHEVIGLDAVVEESSDKSRIGKKGKIVDETHHMLKIETNEGKEILIPKKEVSLRLKLPNGEEIKIEGKKLEEKPENRIKIRRK